jgi:hypothetical protein
MAEPTVVNTIDAAACRRRVYALLITVAAAAAAGRILSAERVWEPSLAPPSKAAHTWHVAWPPTRPEPTPTFGSNDRSRWDTIRALVENGEYVIGRRHILDPTTGKYRDDGIAFEEGYQSIDKVLKPDTNEFYSSKPPLLPTLLAGEYWVLYQLGFPMWEYPWLVVRVILFTAQWLPLVIYLVLLARLVDRYGSTDWGRYFVMACACFGTLVTLFVITLNNHVIAACSALYALYLFLRIWTADGAAPAWVYLLAGFFIAFTACVELPAAALTAGLGLLLLAKFPRRTLIFFVPAAAVPVAAFFLTNYLAIGEWMPAYSKFGGPWYQYEGSPWKLVEGEEKHGIDWAHLREGRGEYALHFLVGHHGLLSLTPVYLLAFAGMIAGLWRRSNSAEDSPPQAASSVPGERLPQVLFPLALCVSVVVIGFYLARTTNYGGWTNGLRWLMWLAPLWLLTMLPVVDRLSGCRRGRSLGYVLLAFSVLSVNCWAWNPWRHPWLYHLFEALGWPAY